MSLALIPSLDPAASDGIIIANDGFYPDLDLTAFKAETGQGDVFPPARLVATLQAAMIEINASIIAWRVDQTAPCLAEIPAPDYGGISEKILLYTRAVFCRARAELVRTTLAEVALGLCLPHGTEVTLPEKPKSSPPPILSLWD